MLLLLTVQINKATVAHIKCPQYDCNTIISDDFIRRHIEIKKALKEKYEQFLITAKIIDDPNKKFCLFPNRNSFPSKNFGLPLHMWGYNGNYGN